MARFALILLPALVASLSDHGGVSLDQASLTNENAHPTALGEAASRPIPWAQRLARATQARQQAAERIRKLGVAAKPKTRRVKTGVKNLPGMDADSGNYECPDKKCKHGGTLQNCKCVCTNGWAGEKCEHCTIDDGHGSSLDKPDSKGKRRLSRRLLAPAFVKGVEGDAEGAGTLGEGVARRRRKKKKKKPPSMGPCAHGSLDAETCSCNCNPDWSGLQCDVCKHEPCQNGGTLNTGACACSCPGNWAGKFCETCTIKGKFPWDSLFDLTFKASGKKCSHGTFHPDSCECKCDPDWAGNLCTDCVHPECGFAGVLDKNFCRCDCVPAWVGRTCQICTHPLCKKKPVDAKACNWAKNDLGCPSLGNLPARPELKPFPKEPSRVVSEL